MGVSRRTFLQGSLAGGVTLRSAGSARSQGAGPTDSDLAYLSIVQASELMRTRQLSPLELIQAVLKRIDEVEPRVQAFNTIARDEALRAARVAEQEIVSGRYRGPLHGIPVGFKDTHYTRGIETTAGSPQLEGFIPTYDATVVARLKEAGAILVGKTRLPAFSMGGNTPSHNPWDVINVIDQIRERRKTLAALLGHSAAIRLPSLASLFDEFVDLGGIPSVNQRLQSHETRAPRSSRMPFILIFLIHGHGQKRNTNHSTHAGQLADHGITPVGKSGGIHQGARH